MVNNYTIRTTYYDRKMDEKLLTQINERFPWIISYVKSHNCLDFQTGNDPKLIVLGFLYIEVLDVY